MSLYTDRQYTTLLGMRLEGFLQKKDYLWTCRCPVCGDSKKNKYKTRGYFYRKQNSIFYMCHNCHVSVSLGTLIKQLDPVLFEKYQLETYQNTIRSNTKSPDFSWLKEKPVFTKKHVVLGLPSLASLPEEHPARVYASSRKLPKLDRLYYAEDFKSFALANFPDTSSGIKKLVDNDQRIVIPFYDENGVLQGVQGRTITNSKIRYITMKLSDECKKMFGLEKVDFTKPIYVTEGPLDSLFLDNAIATMDSSLHTVIQLVGEYSYVFVFDNEPRNKEVCKMMHKAIATGQKICIWPSNILEKDINDMVISGMSAEKVREVVDLNTFSGLEAQLKFNSWKKQEV